MRTPSPIVRVAALTTFVLLLGSFVAYRSGAFDKFFNAAGAQPLTASITDTIPKSDSAKAKTIMPSSKSMTSTDDYEYVISNGKPKKKKKNKKQPENISVDSTTYMSPTIMTSSKSGPVILPKKDTSRKTIMSSSKSGPIIVPKSDTAKKQQ